METPQEWSKSTEGGRNMNRNGEEKDITLLSPKILDTLKEERGGSDK